GNLGGGSPIARIVVAGLSVLAERRLELILLLEVARLLEVRARRRLHRALEADLVVGVVRRRLDGSPVRGDRVVEIAGAHRRLARRPSRSRPGGTLYPPRPRLRSMRRLR